MAVPRDLTSPPISEALVDIRSATTAPAEVFEALAADLRNEFPTALPRRHFQAEFKVENGKLIPPTATELGFQGVLLRTADETTIAQFRPDGFSFNNLKTYMGGDRLLSEALRLWNKFVERMQPSVVTRVAVRYINQPNFPYRLGDDFSRFLTAAPQMPEGAPQAVSEFLSRVVAYDADTRATVVTTQRLLAGAAREDGTAPPEVVIDVDAFRYGEFSVDVATLREMLNQLRSLKNRVFFAHLTEEAVQLFL